MAIVSKIRYVSQLKDDSKTEALVARTLNSGRPIHLKASVQAGVGENLERFESRHSSLEGIYLGSELCAASLHSSMIAGKTQKG